MKTIIAIDNDTKISPEATLWVSVVTRQAKEAEEDQETRTRLAQLLLPRRWQINWRRKSIERIQERAGRKDDVVFKTRTGLRFPIY